MSDFVLSPAAEQDLRDSWGFIAEDSIIAANRVIEKIRLAMRKLAEFPGMGRRRKDLPGNVRSWPVYSYLIIYKPDSSPLEVVRVIHGMRDIPEIFDDPG